jgi:hypothetical protein
MMQFSRYVLGFFFFLFGVLCVDLVILSFFGFEYFEWANGIIGVISISAATSLISYLSLVFFLLALNYFCKRNLDFTDPFLFLLAWAFISGVVFQVTLSSLDLIWSYRPLLIFDLILPVFVVSGVLFLIKSQKK